MDNNDGSKKRHDNTEKNSFIRQVKWKWIIIVFLSSFTISIVLSILSSEGITYLNVFLSCLVLFLFVAIGVIFDIIGLAIATADEKPFLSMAAKKVRGGKTGVKLVRNAEKLSSFCNDVIGDIAGVVSGSTATAIAIKISTSTQNNELLINLLICGLVSALTVGLKAVGKTIGIRYGIQIVTFVAKFISLFSNEEKKKKQSKKVKKGK